MPEGNNGDHDRAGSPSVADDHAQVLDVLEQALDVDDTETTNYHVREALQYLYLENREEIAQLLNKALDTDDPDSAEFFIREAIELLEIEMQVASTD
ncbi:hypothetical protein [Haloarcula nitratireducens]|uniref:Uncharacterized protein n=1 Tax=Haloarcula nitratireducens TaxID=2487749 RepID=A0AAW4PH79_9EURY|nr:hypothetical protein [Halomicroarcula nitratireducens]MBX0296983.1 hypothetical protein [Halomicroarcula nitratireducens]